MLEKLKEFVENQLKHSLEQKAQHEVNAVKHLGVVEFLEKGLKPLLQEMEESEDKG